MSHSCWSLAGWLDAAVERVESSRQAAAQPDPLPAERQSQPQPVVLRIAGDDDPPTERQVPDRESHRGIRLPPPDPADHHDVGVRHQPGPAVVEVKSAVAKRCAGVRVAADVDPGCTEAAVCQERVDVGEVGGGGAVLTQLQPAAGPACPRPPLPRFRSTGTVLGLAGFDLGLTCRGRGGDVGGDKLVGRLLPLPSVGASVASAGAVCEIAAAVGGPVRVLGHLRTPGSAATRRPRTPASVDRRAHGPRSRPESPPAARHPRPGSDRPQSDRSRQGFRRNRCHRGRR